ncbi:DNA polymerase eta [Salvia hispanica]|uniref:DNA polymerase eta n=1 Tax=Salvia hispanica TaxID=49212 RepID=UPI0020098D7B|nr:DNA polymerase eta [Salvia hispanica]
MPVARPESSGSRVIAHVDMDCFYVQVEQRKQPSLRGRPTAVVQYNAWQGGGLIAVGYEARAFGVKRSMRGDEAKKVCPEIELVTVPVSRGKADLTVYRDAGSEVVSILSSKGRCERASIDEVYLDLTEAAETMLAQNSPESLEAISEEALKSHILGLHSDQDGSDNQDRVREWFLSNADRRDKLLACGALIVAELRMEVLKKTEFTCSAGIAHNKMLAKLTSGMHKPAQQTIVPSSSVEELLASLPIKKMKQLGGKLGTSLQDKLAVNTVGDLLQFSEAKLQDLCGINTGTWLWNIARGVCGDQVEGRLLPKSHGSGKTFPGRQALRKFSTVQKWLNDLCSELSERLLRDLEQNKRIARTLTLHASAYKLNDSESLKKFPSKSCSLRYGVSKIQEDALNLFHAGLREYVGVYHEKLKESTQQEWAITGLSVSASKIVDIPTGTNSIMKYFHQQNQTCAELNDACTHDAASLSTSGTTSSIELNQADYPENDVCEDETMLGQVMPCAGPDVKIEVCKDDVYTYEDVDKKDPPFYGDEQSLVLQEDTLTSCLGGSHLISTETGLESKLTQSKVDLLRPRLKSDKKKRKTEKGTSSILRFFGNQESHANLKTFPESGTSSSGTPLDKIPQTTNGIAPRTCNSRTDAWSYKSDEIDPSVLNELPLEIQAEVRAWMQPQKRANVVKKGSSIAHYFSPTPNS